MGDWISRLRNQRNLIPALDPKLQNPCAEGACRICWVAQCIEICFGAVGPPLGIEAGLSSRQAATENTGESPLVVEGYRRSQSFKSVFDKPNVAELIPELNRLHEAISHSKGMEEDAAKQWARGSFPELPVDYWMFPKNAQTVIHYLLVASLVSVAHNAEIALPVDQWRADLASVSGLSPEVDQLLKTLSGATPEVTLEQQTAAVLLELRSGTLQPLELWAASFRLLNAFGRDPLFTEAPLVDLLVPKWIYASTQQRFRFAAPAVVCPKIEQICQSDLDGMAKIATILQETRSSLGVQLDESGIEMIDKFLPH